MRVFAALLLVFLFCTESSAYERPLPYDGASALLHKILLEKGEIDPRDDDVIEDDNWPCSQPSEAAHTPQNHIFSATIAPNIEFASIIEHTAFSEPEGSLGRLTYEVMYARPPPRTKALRNLFPYDLIQHFNNSSASDTCVSNKPTAYSLSAIQYILAAKSHVNILSVSNIDNSHREKSL